VCFAGYGVEKNRLYRTVATRNPNEIGGLWKSGPLRACGRDLPVMKMGLQNSRFCRAGHNQRVNLVFQFSSGLCSSRLFYNPLSDILGRATLRLPRVGLPKADKATKTIRAWVGRDIAPGRV
jgi:hypothetical protein